MIPLGTMGQRDTWDTFVKTFPTAIDSPTIGYCSTSLPCSRESYSYTTTR